MDSVISTDSYLSLLLSLPEKQAITVISAFFLVVMRIVPTMMLAPFFGARNLPAVVRIGFGFAITAILLPHVLIKLNSEIPFDYRYIALGFKELLIGFILAFFVTIPFYIAQSAGGLIDHIRGSASLQVTDPTTQTSTGPIGIFYNYVLIVVFYSLGGPFLYIQAIVRSFLFLPIEGFLNPLFFTISLPFWQKVIGILHYLFSIAIQLGAPSIIGVLMAERVLGIANRLAPQVQIVFLGISLKSWVGLAMLAGAWYFIMQELGKESLKWLDIMDNMILQMSATQKS